MHVDQVSVFLENKSGRLSEVTGILSEAGINIRALALADTSDFGVLRLILDEPDKAAAVLKDNGFTFGKTEVVAVEVEDRPGGLHSILEILKANDINVEYMYAYVRQSGENAIMIFRFDNVTAALEVLDKNQVKVVSSDSLIKI